MIMRKLVDFALLLSLLPGIARSYQWPSPQYDSLEALLYEGVDNMGLWVGLGATDYRSRVYQGGPPVGAEYLRLAFNDMATHNVTDGTGGLDASVYYELDRVENTGAGIVNSLNSFAASANKYVSRADIIAMGVVWGVASCGGPPIAFRGGRIDALEAGRPGVPQPRQDLETHVESFRLQGFTPTEMISLVACGHTIGGVRKLDFPDVLPNLLGDKKFVESFDSTIAAYDSSIVSQYLKGTTQNPLVVGTNSATRSDLRIFSSDGNATMKRMDSPTAFAQTCSTLLARMIDTVPANVQLTEEIAVLPFKIRHAKITFIQFLAPIFTVEIRIRLLPGAPRKVTLLWCDRRGSSAECADGQANFAYPSDVRDVTARMSGPLAEALGIDFVRFEFAVPLAPESVRKFWFEVEYTPGALTVEDNGGAGYVIEQDALIGMSMQSGRATHIGYYPTLPFTIIAAVHGDTAPTLAQVRVYDNTVKVRLRAGQSPDIPPPLNVTLALHRADNIPAAAGYTFYTAAFTAQRTATLDFALEVGGARYTVDFVSIDSFVSDLFRRSEGGRRAVEAVPGVYCSAWRDMAGA